MKTIHENWNNLLHDCLQIALLRSTIGIALKFITFFDQWAYFPTFPNILDSAFLITAVTYLFWNTRKPNKRIKKQPDENSHTRIAKP
jgi:hypothetical protein